MNAMAELIWNALDAEATEVRVEFHENDLTGIEAIRIVDNGHGLPYDHALEAFGSLGGSWKRDEGRSGERKRALHGKYGKGRFRAFALGNRVEWISVFAANSTHNRYSILGHAATLGEFAVSDPEPAPASRIGMQVEIADLPLNAGLLRGVKALQEVTDLFAPYLREYPDIRLIYDGVPIDPANAELRRTECDLGEMILENGERIHPHLLIVEWQMPGRRGIVLCDGEGFALQPVRPRNLFRGFSYTAYIRESHFAVLDREGLLQLGDMTPDVKQVLDVARGALRQHFTLREAENARDLLDQWRRNGIYPYEGACASDDEACERRIFDIYATHLSQLAGFQEMALQNKRLILRMLQELVRSEPTRVPRIVDELINLPADMEDEVMELLQA